MESGVGLWDGSRRIKGSFLTELVQLWSKEIIPIIIGEDFNIYEAPGKRIMTTITIDGISCLMQLSMLLIYEELKLLVDNVLGQII